jgi:DNA-binding MarR family transcriptional regulator
MELKTEIKQSNFSSPQQKAFINVIYTNNYLNCLAKDVFINYDILSQHFNILKIIKGVYPNSVTPAEIIAVMLDKTRDLTRLLYKLESKKWIARSVNSSNKRSIDITLTQLGYRNTILIEKEINELTLNITNLNDEECENLSRLLDKMRG